MSLVKYDENGLKVQSSWMTREVRYPSQRLPDIIDKKPIDYEKLSWLCNIEGLKDRHRENSTGDAHQVFMENYHKMFIKPPKKIGFPVHYEKRSSKQGSNSSVSSKAAVVATSESKNVVPQTVNATDKMSHDIRTYLPLLHKERKSENPAAIEADKLRILRKLLRKLPYERTASDNNTLFKILKTYPVLSDNLPANVLKELCVAATLETWKETNFTVFGNIALYMILRGSVTPLTDPVLKMADDTIIFRSPTPVEEEMEVLGTGKCFGTLQKVEGRSDGTKILSVTTAEPNCEFLKISTSDYARVIDQIRHKEHTEKINLMLSCEAYKLWPRQPLLRVADLIQWLSYPPNTVLISEGYNAPYMAFIKSGECHVLRQVEAKHKLKNGKHEKRTKQVVMGRLGQSDSFAEQSVLLDEPMTCSIVTASAMQIGVIRPERLKELDEVTIQLLQQSSKKTFGNLSKIDIEDEYIRQELKKEWNEFKHNVVVDVINYRGIRPGYGKWAKD